MTMMIIFKSQLCIKEQLDRELKKKLTDMEAAYTRKASRILEGQYSHFQSSGKISFKISCHQAKLASRYLVAQSTSVVSERVFSTSEDILSAERSCLDLDVVDSMIFLKKNASEQSEFLC